MTVDFPQGVPDGCLAWLEQYVGTGLGGVNYVPYDEAAWFYERRFQLYPNATTSGSYIPSITVKDPKKATWFALRWS